MDNGANQSKFRTKILVEIDDGAHLILELKQNNKNVDFLGCYSRGNLANVKEYLQKILMNMVMLETH